LKFNGLGTIGNHFFVMFILSLIIRLKKNRSFFLNYELKAISFNPPIPTFLGQRWNHLLFHGIIWKVFFIGPFKKGVTLIHLTTFLTLHWTYIFIHGEFLNWGPIVHDCTI
jgi:hypothetical protein